MDSQIRSAINRFIAQGNPNILSRPEIIQLMCLLSKGRASVALVGVDRTVDDWSATDGAAGNPRGTGTPSYLNGIFSSFEQASQSLVQHTGLPPLSQWSVDDEDGRYYSTSVVEDRDGVVDPVGDFLVDYVIRVELRFSLDTLPEDFTRTDPLC